MITHEEARIASMLTTVEASRTMIDYINQQEKVTELLGLYREHHRLVPFTTGLGDKSKRVCDISIEIKHLEKELGEMK